MMLFYANYLIIPSPYPIPFPLTGERDVSFWRYGVRCFIYKMGWCSHRGLHPRGITHVKLI